MSTRRARLTVQSVVAAVIAFTLVACGGGGDDSDSDDSKKSGDDKSQSSQGGQSDDVDTDKTVGELKGPNGVVVSVHSAVRDSGGFVTIRATLENKGKQDFDPVRLKSEETAIKSKSDISGATLVDKKSKKRYMILRDTDGQCLCTTSIPLTKPGDTRPIFAQFPAPPKDSKEAEFQLPTMSPVTLELSEG